MVKRMKKPPVRPEQLTDWLRRSEMEGESSPNIAKRDGYDVRTVRKHLDLARQERETREARSTVLRRALEQHYADLIAVVGRVDAQVSNPAGIPIVGQDERLWKALREHIPRAALWKLLGRWERLQQQRIQIHGDVVLAIEQEIEGTGNYKFAAIGDTFGLNRDGIAKLVTHRLTQVAKAPGEPPEPDIIQSEDVGNDSVRIVCAAIQCATVPREEESQAKAFLRRLQVGIKNRPEAHEARRVHAELSKVTAALREELATILLRRVVPGRCKYCPF